MNRKTGRREGQRALPLLLRERRRDAAAQSDLPVFPSSSETKGDKPPRHSSHLPERRSAVSRARAPKPSLVRIVLGPDRRPYVDLLGRAPGRAIYVKPDRAELKEALSPKGLARGFQGKALPLDAEAAETIIDALVGRLEDRILELVSLARRAGRVQIGMEAVQRAAEAGALAVLVAAKDLSERSERALPAGIPIIRVSEKDALGARLGRQEVGVVGVVDSVFRDRLAWEAERLLGLLGTSGPALEPSTNAIRRGRVQADVGPRQVATREKD